MTIDCIAAVSGGPDSMYLLSWLIQNDHHPFVCHVNYHHRPTACRDEQIVREFCLRHQIPFSVLHPTYTRGNFQDWARQVRYSFFLLFSHVYQVCDIYIAHQQDDLLETWLLQQERGALVKTWGLQEKTPYEDAFLIRPLLSYRKKELEEKCIEQHIPYGLDESNFENEYRRNQIRHQLETLNQQQQRSLLHAYRLEREIQLAKQHHIQQLAEQRLLSSFQSSPEGWLGLEALFFEATHSHFSYRCVQDALTKLQDGHCVRLKDQIFQVIEGKVCQAPASKWEPFIVENEAQLQLLLNRQFSHPYFSFSKTGKRIQSVTLQPDDFPLMIRPPRSGDSIEMRYGQKKISRFFIDRQIPQFIRHLWPIIENSKKRIIFVPRLGCDIQHFSAKPSFYMLESTLSNTK